MEELYLICVLPKFVSKEEREICKFTYGDEYFNNAIHPCDLDSFKGYVKIHLPKAKAMEYDDSYAVYCPEDLVEDYSSKLCALAFYCKFDKSVTFKHNHQFVPVMVGKIYDMLPTRERFNLGKSQYDIDQENSNVM